MRAIGFDEESQKVVAEAYRIGYEAAQNRASASGLVTMSENSAKSIAETNYRRGQEHERARCACIAEVCRTNTDENWDDACRHIAACIREGVPTESSHEERTP